MWTWNTHRNVELKKQLLNSARWFSLEIILCVKTALRMVQSTLWRLLESTICNPLEYAYEKKFYINFLSMSTI